MNSKVLSCIAAASSAGIFALVTPPSSSGVNKCVERMLMPQPFLHQKSQCEELLKHKLIRVNVKKVDLPQNGFETLRNDIDNFATREMSTCQDFI